MADLDKIKLDFEKEIKKLVDEVKISAERKKVTIKDEMEIIGRNLTYLEKEIDKVKAPYASKLKSKIKYKTPSKNGSSAVFDEFIYFIDRLNELDYPKYIYDKNPNFCDEIISKIAEYYLELKEVLEANCRIKQKEYANSEIVEFDKQRKLAMEKINNFYYKKLIGIAQKEVEEIDSKIRKELG